MVNIVCDMVLSGLVCCSGRRMDLIPRAEHRVGRMRLSMELAHLGRGGNSGATSAMREHDEPLGSTRLNRHLSRARECAGAR